MFVVPLLVFAITNWGHIAIEEAKKRRQEHPDGRRKPGHGTDLGTHGGVP